MSAGRLRARVMLLYAYIIDAANVPMKVKAGVCTLSWSSKQAPRARQRSHARVELDFRVRVGRDRQRSSSRAGEMRRQASSLGWPRRHCLWLMVSIIQLAWAVSESRRRTTFALRTHSLRHHQTLLWALQTGINSSPAHHECLSNIARSQQEGIACAMPTRPEAPSMAAAPSTRHPCAASHSGQHLL